MGNTPITAVGNKCGVHPVNGKEAVPSYELEYIGESKAEVYSAKRNDWWNEGDGVEVIMILRQDSLVIIKKNKTPQTGKWTTEQFAKVKAEKVDGTGFVTGWILAKHLHKMREI